MKEKLITVLLCTCILASCAPASSSSETTPSISEPQTNETEQSSSMGDDNLDSALTEDLSKESKNGFDSSTNQSETIGEYKIEIPEYFGENTSTDDSALIFYSEKGTGCTMLSISIVNYDKSEQEFNSEKDQLLQAYISGMEKTGQIVIQDLNIEKKRFSGSIAIDNNSIIFDGEIDTFLLNDKAYVIYLIQSRESLFDYFEDYKKIKASMQKISIEEESVNEINGGDSEKDIITEIMSAIQGDVGEGETITDVTLNDRDLCVYVDLGEEDNKIISREQIAVSRVASITDSILELEEYDEEWDTVTVDFGVFGRVTNSKKNIHDDGYGRYFMPSNGGEFVLTETGEQPENNIESNTETSESISIDDFASLIETVLNQSPSLNSKVSYAEDTVNVDLWADGISTVAASAALGNAESINGWEEVKKGVQTLAESLSKLRYSSGAENYNVVLNVLNDLDKTKTLLTYKNGELVYDVVYE